MRQIVAKPTLKVLPGGATSLKAQHNKIFKSAYITDTRLMSAYPGLGGDKLRAALSIAVNHIVSIVSDGVFSAVNGYFVVVIQ